MSIFVRTLLFFKAALSIAMETMRFHVTKALFLRTIFLHFNDPIEQIYTHNEMSYVFNVGLITPLDIS